MITVVLRIFTLQTAWFIGPMISTTFEWLGISGTGVQAIAHRWRSLNRFNTCQLFLPQTTCTGMMVILRLKMLPTNGDSASLLIQAVPFMPIWIITGCWIL